jgi:hypothetical protein
MSSSSPVLMHSEHLWAFYCICQIPWLYASFEEGYQTNFTFIEANYFDLQRCSILCLLFAVILVCVAIIVKYKSTNGKLLARESDDLWKEYLVEVWFSSQDVCTNIQSTLLGGANQPAYAHHLATADNQGCLIHAVAVWRTTECTSLISGMTTNWLKGLSLTAGAFVCGWTLLVSGTCCKSN